MSVARLVNAAEDLPTTATGLALEELMAASIAHYDALAAASAMPGDKAVAMAAMGAFNKLKRSNYAYADAINAKGLGYKEWRIPVNDDEKKREAILERDRRRSEASAARRAKSPKGKGAKQIVLDNTGPTL